MPRPTISSQYDYIPGHWYFARDSKLPRDTFDRPLSERLAECSAEAVVVIVVSFILFAILI